VGQILFFVLAGGGIFMFLVGRLQEKIRPGWIIFIGALLGGSAVLMVGHAPGIRWVYIWGFVNGASSAFAYLPAITVAQRWYPLRRGLAAGLVSMCFGISGAVLAPVFSYGLQTLGYSPLAAAAGVATIAIGTVSALLVRLPAKPAASASDDISADIPGVLTLTLGQSLRTRSFWLLWFTYALAGAAGMAMVPLSIHFGVHRGLAITQAVLILTAFNLTNGLSRFVSGYFSDVMGRKQVLGSTLLLAGLAYFLFPYLSGQLIWSLLAAVIGFSFGTLHSVAPPMVSDCFGIEKFGSVFGMVFTAFGFVSGALGPWLSGFLLDITRGNFTLVFFYLGVLLVSASLLVLIASSRTECRF
jgi:OFA family oxalate/formate antiporter-like MFS transporter